MGEQLWPLPLKTEMQPEKRKIKSKSQRGFGVIFNIIQFVLITNPK